MASKSEQLIACMSKAKGNAKKIAACKSSFSESLKGMSPPQGPRADDLEYLGAMLKAGQSDEDKVWGKFIRKGSIYNPTGQDSVVLDSLIRDKSR